MAQLISVKFSRCDSSPWGFRLQGGKDFGTPLVIQKVNNGSPAEALGLHAGDMVIRVNNIEVFNLKHKDAQDVIVKAGNNFDLTIQRGGNTWKPMVSPVTATIPAPQPLAPVSSITPVTRTSLAAKNQDIHLIGSAHNLSPKPFLNESGESSVKSIVNKQYNSPVGIYSEETIAETLSAQAEVLAGGVLGVNFKKNEKNYNAQDSEVFKMVQEADKEPRMSESVEASALSELPSPSSQLFVSPHMAQTLETKCHETTPHLGLPTGQNICAECERIIIGVFVRIKEKNLHVECFKCSTCGTSLKNVGYYNINNKLYCDIHAKLVARQQAPTGVLPVITPQGQKAPANAISAALTKIGRRSPTPSNHGNSPPHLFSIPTNHISGPKPYIGLNCGNNNYSTSPVINSKNNNTTCSINQFSTGRLSTLPRSSSFKGTGSSGNRSGNFAGNSIPNRGRGILNQAGSELRVPLCAVCNSQVRGPFISALGQIWCPEHFVCANSQCGRTLQDIGFVEEKDNLYCEYCFERFIAPSCNKCNTKIKGDCLNAVGKHFHPECFNCTFCGKHFGNNPFFLEEGLPYCESDWNDLFTTKCFACGFPVEAGDRWVEALSNNYHSQCFNCTMCKMNLEGQTFYAKGGRPFCKNHAR